MGFQPLVEWLVLEVIEPSAKLSATRTKGEVLASAEGDGDAVW